MSEHSSEHSDGELVDDQSRSPSPGPDEPQPACDTQAAKPDHGGASGSKAASPSSPASSIGGLSRQALLVAVGLPLAFIVGAATSSAVSTAALEACRSNAAADSARLASLTRNMQQREGRVSVAESQLQAREMELHDANLRIARLQAKCGWWCSGE